MKPYLLKGDMVVWLSFRPVAKTEGEVSLAPALAPPPKVTSAGYQDEYEDDDDEAFESEGEHKNRVHYCNFYWNHS